MKHIITESEINRIYLRILLEEFNLDDYEDSDFYDVFLLLFKEWVAKKMGEEYKRYPTSYLLKKYGREFEKEMDIHNQEDDEFDNEEEDISYRDYDTWRIIDAAKKLVEKGKYSLPSLNTSLKFTEKYKKALPFVGEHLDISKNVKIEFSEDTPNRVFVDVTVDFPKYITDPNSRKIDKYDLKTDIKNFLSGYLGVEFGNPSYGAVDLNYGKFEFIGIEDWVQNVLNKKIKKDIKQLPNSKILHSIRFIIPDSDIPYIKLIFKDIWDSQIWRDRLKFKNSVKQYLEKEGYNTQILKVED